MQLEPGVLTLYAIAEKERPNHIYILEIYADEVAYQSHLPPPFPEIQAGNTRYGTIARTAEYTSAYSGAENKVNFLTTAPG